MYKSLSRGRKVVKASFISMLLTSMFIALLTVEATAINTYNDTQGAESASYYVLTEPDRIQEGFNTTITVGVRGAEANTTYTLIINVTSPTSASYTTSLAFTTNETGFGSGSVKYWGDLPNANTNFVGAYSIAVNETIANGSFTVGLTDKLQYRRGETVYFRGSGYGANETVTVNVNTSGVSIAGYPKNVTATADGVASDSWEIPVYAARRNYTVTLANATTHGTVKTPTDSQDFMVEAVCQIQTRNLADEPVAGVSVEVYGATTDQPIYGMEDEPLSETTDETGWAEFEFEAGNYTFRAFWAEVEVSSLINQSVGGSVVLILRCQLSNIRIDVEDEAGVPLPFIDLTVAFNYTTRHNATLPGKQSLETNSTGLIELYNIFSTVSYTIEARRYGLLYNKTVIPNLNQLLENGWANITIKCPTYKLFVNALDSAGEPIPKAQIEVYEWSGKVPVGSGTTNDSGSITFNLRFGRYKIGVHYDSVELKDRVLLNETVVDLTQDRHSLMIHCKIFNVKPSVVIVDYFGQPIPNAIVEMERKVDEKWVKIEPSGKTDSTGVASLPSIGGNYRISVYMLGELCETRILYLDQTKQIVFKLDKYVMISGYPLATSQLTTTILLSLLVVSLALASTYRRLLRKTTKKKVAP